MLHWVKIDEGNAVTHRINRDAVISDWQAAASGLHLKQPSSMDADQRMKKALLSGPSLQTRPQTGKRGGTKTMTEEGRLKMSLLLSSFKHRFVEYRLK